MLGTTVVLAERGMSPHFLRLSASTPGVSSAWRIPRRAGNLIACQTLAPRTSDSIKRCKSGYLDVGEILAHVNDVLTPPRFDEILKDDFAALRQMLQH